MTQNREGIKRFESVLNAVIARESGSETATDASRDAGPDGASMGRVVFSAELRYTGGKFTLDDFRFERVRKAMR